ncbi:MAG: DUF4097 family beta strand repeat-containing protein [Blastocatellia bacterium]|nr:DUF4097 family beta strand repeat-containing protein [Blastocatellia bacterium]
MIKRIATLLLGIGLIGLGALFFLAPEQSLVTQMLMRYWPVFLILAGGVRFAGYLIDRQPKSPVGAILLMALGGILLSSRLLGHNSFLLILGKYWFWALLAFILGRILLQYLHRIQDGPRPKAFSPGAVLAMILIAGGGMLAGLAQKNAVFHTGLDRLGGLFGGALLGEGFVINDNPITLPVAANARLAFSEVPGDIEISASNEAQASIQLTKRVRAQNETKAAEQAENVRLRIDSRGGNHSIRVLIPEDASLSGLTVRVQLPLNLVIGVDAQNVSGQIRLTALRGDHAIRDCNSVTIYGNAGRVAIENPTGPLELAEVQGEVTLRNTRTSLLLREIKGAITLESSGGSVTAQKTSGPIRIHADNTRISLSEVGTDAFAAANQPVVRVEETANSRISLNRIKGGVSINAERTRIDAEEITGDTSITNSHDRILVNRITGALKISANDGSVESEEIRGAAVIEASRNITIRNFLGPLNLKSETGAIEIKTDGKLAGDLQAISDRGRIRVSLPEDGGFLLDAQTDRGRVRLSGFPQFTLERDELALKIGFNLARPAPRVRLRLGRGDIQLQSSGLALAASQPSEQNPTP